jgi:hypothetical protein
VVLEKEGLMKINGDIVVGHAPKQFPRQEGLTCGEANLKAILAGFNIPYKPPEALRLRIRLFGYSFVQDISDLLDIHGLSAPLRHANNYPKQEKLAIIKNHIDSDESVLLAIGNGYLQRGVYTPIARYFIGHYVTIYGYSDVERVFYIYDPYLGGSYPGKIPVGNDTRTFDDLIRDWHGPLYYKFVGMDHVYIPAGNGVNSAA